MQLGTGRRREHRAKAENERMRLGTGSYAEGRGQKKLDRTMHHADTAREIHRRRSGEGSRTNKPNKKRGEGGNKQPRPPKEEEQSQQNKHQKKEQEEETTTKGGRGKEKAGIGGYAPDASLVRGVRALNYWFEPRTVVKFMCDESIIADCLVHGCLQLECTITRVYMSAAFFVGILPDSSKLRDIPGDVGIAAL